MFDQLEYNIYFTVLPNILQLLLWLIYSCIVGCAFKVSGTYKCQTKDVLIGMLY